VPRTTVQDRMNGALTRVDAHAHERRLTDVQEDVLAEWIKVWISYLHSFQLSDADQSLAKRGLPLSLTPIGDYAAEIFGSPLGVTWPVRFKKRHPDLKVKWTTALEACRAQSLTRPVVHDYFTLLAETIEPHSLIPSAILTRCTQGIQLGIADKTRVLVDRDQKVVRKIESGNRELVTIIEAISADGSALHPSVVFQGQR
ncbi:hypothetical protein DFH09DRAFT_1501894, partial [Mycena vulgaris]